MVRGHHYRCVLLAVLLLFVAVAPAAAKFQLPPPDDRSVHDFAGVLPSDVVQRLEARHAELFQKTGVALVVVIIPRLDGEPIEDFAVRVGKEWGAGKKGQDRGIVVALSTQDRRVFIATGYGVEGFLPDGRVGGILDSFVIPRLKQDDFSGGIQAASAELTATAAAEYHVTIAGTPRVPSSMGGGKGFSLFRSFWQILVAIIFLYFLLRHPSLFWWMLLSGRGRGYRYNSRTGGFRSGGFGSGGFGSGGGGGFGGFGGGGFGGGGAGRGF